MSVLAAPQDWNKSKPKMTHPVLVVDCEPQIRRMVRLLLSKDGLPIVEAAHGSDALAVIRQASGKIALLVTDLHMDCTDGTELVRQVAKEFPSIPMLFMSASAIPAGIETLATRSAFLSKPFSPALLRSAVRDLLAV